MPASKSPAQAIYFFDKKFFHTENSMPDIYLYTGTFFIHSINFDINVLSIKPLTGSTFTMNCINKISLTTFAVLLLTLLFFFPCFAANSDDPKQVVFVRYNLKGK